MIVLIYDVIIITEPLYLVMIKLHIILNTKYYEGSGCNQKDLFLNYFQATKYLLYTDKSSLIIERSKLLR